MRAIYFPCSRVVLPTYCHTLWTAVLRSTIIAVTGKREVRKLGGDLQGIKNIGSRYTEVSVQRTHSQNTLEIQPGPAYLFLTMNRRPLLLDT